MLFRVAGVLVCLFGIVVLVAVWYAQVMLYFITKDEERDIS